MKGLMLKELYLSRKLRLFGAVIWFVMTVFCVLVRLSALYGNIALLGESSAERACDIAYYIMVFGGSMILYALQFSNSVVGDEKSGFRIYEHTLPVREEKLVGAVYLTNICAFGAVTLVNYIVLLIAGPIFGRSLDPRFLLYIPAIGLTIYVLSLIKGTLNYCIRNPKKASAILTVCVLAVYFGAFFGFAAWINRFFEERSGIDLFSGMSETEREAALEKVGLTETQLMKEFEDKLMDILRWLGDNSWWLVPLILGSLAALCFFLSVRGLKRRGGRC
ncbi:MAG: hypothetical protein IKO27_03935 [Ruminococcus sp.]|nr:hypothetical protein [Ruminococcus sp.]